LDFNCDVELLGEELELGFFGAEREPVVVEADFTECDCVTGFFG
jgi:hypothetical protein